MVAFIEEGWVQGSNGEIIEHLSLRLQWCCDCETILIEVKDHSNLKTLPR